MRWILPLLSLALVPAALGEIAVYTGTMSVQNVSTPRSSIVRVADVIDLATGHIVTIGLTGGRTDFSYAVGPEVPYVVARTNDGHGHGITAFAQAASDTDSAGSKFAMAANLRGRDMTVNLSDAGAAQWPRTLTGTGSLVAAAGTDAVTTPASASFSVLTLTLSEPLSQVANASGGTLSQAAEVVAQQYRNRIAAALKFTPVNSNVVAGPTTGSAGLSLTKTGTGTLVFGSTSNAFTGAVTINAGTLRLTGTGSVTGGATTTINGGSLLLNGGTPVGGAVTTVSSGSLGVSGVTITGALGNLTTSGATLNLGAANTINPINLGSITQAGSLDLTKVGSGTLILNNSGSVNFTGSTIGYTGSGSAATGVIGSSIFTLNNSGSLTGLGSTSGNVVIGSNLNSINLGQPLYTISEGNLLNPSGATVGSLTVNVNGSTNLTLTDPTVTMSALAPTLFNLTKTGSGTLTVTQVNGTTFTVTGAATPPVNTTPADPTATP